MCHVIGDPLLFYSILFFVQEVSLKLGVAYPFRYVEMPLFNTHYDDCF